MDENLREWILERNENAMLADGFEDAIIGMAHVWRPDPPGQKRAMVVVYDADKCIDILMERDGMTEDGAIEYFDFNVIGGYSSANQPVYFWRYDKEE